MSRLYEERIMRNHEKERQSFTMGEEVVLSSLIDDIVDDQLYVFDLNEEVNLELEDRNIWAVINKHIKNEEPKLLDMDNDIEEYYDD